MPLRLVPDLPSEPDDVAMLAAAPEVPAAPDGELPASAVPSATVPFRWFPCEDPHVGASVRAHLLSALNTWAVDTDAIADAMVMVSELITNVRDHSDSDEVGIRVRVSTDRIVVAVVEKSGSDAPAGGRLQPGVADGDEPDSPLRDRGRGLRILDSMASEWGFVRRGGVTTTWFAIEVSSPAFAAREPDIRRF